MSGLSLLAFNGLVWGLIVALMSLGLNLIYGVLGVVNVAHGALYMLGAVLGWALAQQLGFWAAALLAPLLVAVLGAMAERLTLRPLLGRPAMTILATFGWMLIAQQAVVLSPFGPGQQRLGAPLSGVVWLGAAPYPAYRLGLAVMALGLIALVGLVLHKTRLGAWMRAVRQNPELALGLGIPVPRVFTLTFALGAWLAALAGVLSAPLVAVHALMGADLLILAFLVVVVGGGGNLAGAVVVAVAARVLEGALSAWIQPTEAQLLTWLALGALLLWRPHGVFQKAA